MGLNFRCDVGVGGFPLIRFESPKLRKKLIESCVDLLSLVLAEFAIVEE